MKFPERKRKAEKRWKDQDLIKVVDSTIDPRTENILFEISRRLNIVKIFGAISSGKEAKVYPAMDDKENWYAIKVYYVSTASHKRAVKKYMMGDPRFMEVRPKSTRHLISTWAKKEFKNLKRLYDADVRVPRPYLVLENVLVMEFIGEDGVSAPLLKDVNEDLITQELYMDLIEQIKRMVKVAKLVHGDLSEYNVLVHNSKPYIIDVSQSITIDHQNWKELLERDLRNINNFFSSKGIRVMPLEDIFKMILE
ncbi:MAG: serine protein kinase RIO [Sulfolobaceae archaeon]